MQPHSVAGAWSGGPCRLPGQPAGKQHLVCSSLACKLAESPSEMGRTAVQQLSCLCHVVSAARLLAVYVCELHHSTDAAAGRMHE